MRFTSTSATPTWSRGYSQGSNYYYFTRLYYGNFATKAVFGCLDHTSGSDITLGFAIFTLTATEAYTSD